MRWGLLVMLVILLPGAAALARTDPPDYDPFQYLPQVAEDPTLTISSASLTIRPVADISYLQFSGGVSVSTQGIKLSANEVALEILTGTLPDLNQELPRIPDEPELLGEDPGGVIAEMMGEMDLPSPQLSTSAFRRVEASGSVFVNLGNFTLTTDSLESNDSGRSWFTRGLSTLTGRDLESGTDLSLAMEHLVIDTETNSALAKGSVQGRIKQPTEDEVMIAAETLEISFESKQITVSDSLLIQRGSLSLYCGAFSADLTGNQVDASGRPRLQDSERDMHAEMGGIRYDLDSQELVAFGGVVITDEARDLSLEAGELRGSFFEQLFIAWGEPRVTYGDSTFEGKKITVRLMGDNRAQVEVDGPQAAEIYIDSIQPDDDSHTSE